MNENEEMDKCIEELVALGYRIRQRSIKYMYNHGEVVGRKFFFDVEKKVM